MNKHNANILSPLNFQQLGFNSLIMKNEDDDCQLTKRTGKTDNVGIRLESVDDEKRTTADDYA